MFWGLIMEPNKRYTQVVERPFHISQAALDISTGDSDPCQVMVVVDGKNFLVCTLQKNKCIQVPLDLYFKAGESISFLINGKCNAHLTGYLDPEFEDEPSDEEEEDDEEEVPALVPAKNKRKMENSGEGSASKKAKPDKKASKKAAAAEESSDDDDGDEDDNRLQRFLDGEDIDTDENDDSFKVNTSAEPDSDSDEEESDEEAEEEGGEEDDDDVEEEKDSTLDTSRESQDTSKLSKSARRRLKRKENQEKKKQEKQPQVNGVEKVKKEKPVEQKEKKQKGEGKKEAQDGQAGDKKEKKTLSGGVFIEDMKVGNGPAAKPGKNVVVYYEGRLKQNNKMFDKCIKGEGFKFRLGAKEVITGWDAGIAGMKVGGKRKIVCPPAMAYGAKGSPPVIPPNSTLVFEVELKNVK